MAIKIGINMAGAISAGAYTAGVLDFLTEALDLWEQAKLRSDPVPLHDVSLEVLSGASAGGMCAAIASLMLHKDFEHIRDTSKTGTTNRLYESWVNRADINKLLQSDDLRNRTEIISLLDSSIVTQIAAYALTPGPEPLKTRAYVSADLALFLSLTNLRGTPYSLNGQAPGSVEETTFFFGDRIRFQVQSGTSAAPLPTNTHLLDVTNKNSKEWGTLQKAAMATGAFPILLAPRILERNLSEYTPPMWESVTAAATGNPPPISPDFPPGTPDPLQTLNVDGGVTNNDPFMYAHDYLAKLQPPLPTNTVTVPAEEVDRTAITVAPFPTTKAFDIHYNPVKAAGVFSVLGKLISVLLSQSRFFGESLTHVMNGTTLDRFVIAPSDPELVHESKGYPPQSRPPALQCAALGGFGGFFYRGFRAHDYALGRRNCQKFLRDSFILPDNNVIIRDGLQKAGAGKDAILEKFGRAAPLAYIQSAEEPAFAQTINRPGPRTWLPIIPLCDAAAEPIRPIPRAKMNRKTLDEIMNLIMSRFKGVMAILLSHVHSKPLRIFLRIGQPAIRFLARSPLRGALIRGFGDSYQP